MADKIEMILTLRLKSIISTGEHITNIARNMEESGHIDGDGLDSIMADLNEIQNNWVVLNDIYLSFRKFEMPIKEKNEDRND